MGIPHLLTHLQPYGVDTPLDGIQVVLDGPSLAYHIWHLCSKNKDAQPSHQLLTQTALTWLETLACHGVQIQAIYFDGFLPSAKRDVRMDRLLKMSLKLQHLHSAHSATCPEKFVLEAGDDSEGLQKASDRRKDPVHTPAFLVPAILDCLRSSPQFGSLVRLVPGEADVYCAQHVLERGGCVVTSDSDLMLHDLDSGSVLLFWSLEILAPALSISQNERQKASLSSPAFSPLDIARRLGIPSKTGGMMRFGFELFNNPHASLSQIVESCQRPAKSPKAFDEFCRPYETLPQEALLEAEAFSGCGGKYLDPRISEIVLQSSSYMKKSFPAVPTTTTLTQDPPRVFLPLLFDCSAKASAWDSSTRIRQLAYSLLLQAYPDPSWSCVREFRRIHSLSNKGRKIDLLGDSTMSEAAIALSQSLDHLFGELGDREKSLLGLTLHLDLEVSEAEGKEPSSLSYMQNVLRGKAHAGHVAWTTIQLVAQLQATIYSLRMLSQIMRVVLSGSTIDAPMKDALERLENHLGKLPELTEYPTVVSLTGLLNGLKKDNQLGPLASVLGVRVSELSQTPVRRPHGSGQRENHRKKRKTNSKGASAPNPSGKLSVNPFDILGDA